MVNQIPTLSVSTQPLEENMGLIRLADPQSPLIWVKNGHGFVGVGECARFSFRGAERFKKASAVIKQLAEKATVTDLVGRQGTGLTVLGAFSFADNSERESVLIVPRILVGSDSDGGWITTVHASGEPAPLTPTGNPVTQADVIASFIEPEGEAAAYRAGVLDAARRIAGDEAQKIVLARRLIAIIPEGSDLRVPLKKLAERYTDCWTFAIDGMIGASPETLIRSVGGEVNARVLAGTRKRSVDSERDLAMRNELAESSKELFEHRLAIDSLIQTLRPFVKDLEFDENPYLLQLPNVWHLASNVRATLTAGVSSIELAGAVHPTAAVAGTPTDVAIKAIDELEPFDRERYAGAIGWANASGDGDWAIALRSAQVDGQSVTAYAGGGLVAGSDPWHELTETVAKFRPIIEAFS